MTAATARAPRLNLHDERLLAAWRDRSRMDATLAAIGAGHAFAFALVEDSRTMVLRVADGTLASWTLDPDLGTSWDFSLCATAEVWARFFSAEPPPRYHNLFALLMRVPEFSIQGDRVRFMRWSAIVRRLLEIARALHSGDLPEAVPLALAPASSIRAGYAEIALGEERPTIYYEEAGSGPTLLCLHTAGADSRQYQRLLRTERLTRHWRLVAFDLPGHGKSSMFAQPPGSHRLTTDLYARTIRATMTALDITDPVVVGSSMGGEICLEMAYRYPDEIRAVIACEAAARVLGRKTPWANDPRFDSASAIPEYIYGLMAPTSPSICKQEVWWQYSQGGYGTFASDVAFYAGDWDATERAAKIDTHRCPVYMLTGEYDYSCTPELSAETAALIPGASFTVMKRLGHFPMSENPSLFLYYVEPVLEEIAGGIKRVRDGSVGDLR